jgi:hypothetical protein
MDSSFIGLKNIADITKLTALSYSCYFFLELVKPYFMIIHLHRLMLMPQAYSRC